MPSDFSNIPFILTARHVHNFSMPFDIWIVLALALMVLGIVGSITPMMPGALLSIAGVLVYWYGNSFTQPDTWFLAAFVLTGLFAVATDYLSGVVAAKAGGASTRTSIAAGVAGFLLFFVLGPIGILVGVAGTVLIREFLRTGDSKDSIKAAVYSTVGVLGSTVVQVVVTVSLLLAFIVALLL